MGTHQACGQGAGAEAAGPTYPAIQQAALMCTVLGPGTPTLHGSHHQGPHGTPRRGRRWWWHQRAALVWGLSHDQDATRGETWDTASLPEGRIPV